MDQHKDKGSAQALTRRGLIKRALGAGSIAAAASSMGVAAPALAKGSPEITWRMVSSFPKSLEIIHDVAEIFIKYTAEATDNRFKIEIVPAKIVGAKSDAATAVTKGKVEIAHTSSGFYWEKDPTFALGAGLPFGLNSRAMSAWMLEGGGRELLDSFYARHNLYAIVAGSTGCQMGGWWHKELKSLDQLEGVKLLSSGFAGKIMTRLGIEPQMVANGDIYKAFASGRLDAVEWVGPYDDEKLALYKVTKNYYYPGWWAPGPMLHMFINRAKWETLPKSYQAIMERAGQAANGVMLARYDAKNPAALKRMLRKGVQLRAFPRPIMMAAFEAAEKTYAETASSNAMFKKIFDNWHQFRADQYLWSQVAELGMDAFQSEVINR